MKPHAHHIERPLTAGGVCYPPYRCIPGVMLYSWHASHGIWVCTVTPVPLDVGGRDVDSWGCHAGERSEPGAIFLRNTAGDDERKGDLGGSFSVPHQRGPISRI